MLCRLNLAPRTNGSTGEDLCLSCGLCCNGVLFADVKVRRADDRARLELLGMKLHASSSSVSLPPGNRALVGSAASRSLASLPQPCAALDGCRCQIYGNRPKYCREFECAVLKGFNAKRLRKASALRIIGEAVHAVDRVKGLLRELGDTDEDLPLKTRFHRTEHRFHRIGFERASAALFGDLTLAYHDLNLSLSENFYPGTREF